MLSSLFLSATNHLLAQAGWARQRLPGHAGRTARLELAPVGQEGVPYLPAEQVGGVGGVKRSPGVDFGSRRRLPRET